MPTTKRSWQRAQARGGMALTGVFGLPASKASTVKEHQPKTFSAGVSPGSPQSGIDRRTVGAALDLAIGERAPHIVGDVRPAAIRGMRIWPVGPTMRRDRVGELDRRIGEEPAPIAGMMAALARIDPEIESDRAARAEEDGRPPGGEPRPVGGDQHVRRESVACASRQSSRRPGEPISSPISIRYLALKPSLPRVSSTARERRRC